GGALWALCALRAGGADGTRGTGGARCSFIREEIPGGTGVGGIIGSRLNGDVADAVILNGVIHGISRRVAPCSLPPPVRTCWTCRTCRPRPAPTTARSCRSLRHWKALRAGRARQTGTVHGLRVAE